MNSFVKGVDQINRLATWVVVIMTAVMSVIILAQVIFRYVLEAPLPWSEEVARYLMVWGTFLGAGLGVRKRALLGMEFVVNILPKFPKRMVTGLVTIIQLIFLVVVFYYGIKMTMVTKSQLSAAMQISMAWAYSGIPVGITLMFLNTIANAIEDRLGGAK